MELLQHIYRSKKEGRKLLTVLIDPDSISKADLIKTISLAQDAHVDFLFVGGSTFSKNNLDQLIQTIKESCEIPIIIFPGSSNQVSKYADGILFMSLISGRNPEYLIGKQVESAGLIAESDLEILPTGYMLIDGGRITSVNYISNTMSIPRGKITIAQNTALAGQFLGLKLIYLEAGSGAKFPVPSAMIKGVKNKLDIPIIVGGGLSSPDLARDALNAGADMVVIGNILEKNPELVLDFSAVVHSVNSIVK